MNDGRRKKLDRASALISEATGLIEEVRDLEQDSFDNLPEALQQGEKGEAMEAAVTSLEAALDGLSEALAGIEEAQV
jgi:hypothetical protein